MWDDKHLNSQGWFDPYKLYIHPVHAYYYVNVLLYVCMHVIFQLMVEMELRTKCRLTDMKENWKGCKESLTRNVYRMVHMKVPDKDQCDIPGSLIIFCACLFYLRATRGAHNPNLQFLFMHALHVCSQHSFGLPLIRMNGMYRMQCGHKRVSLKFKCCYYLFVVQSADSTWYNKELLPSKCLFCIPSLKANYIQSVEQALYILCHFSDDEDGALIMHLSDVFGCEPLFYFMDKVRTQETKRVLKNSESTYSTSFNKHRIMKEIFMLLYKKY